MSAQPLPHSIRCTTMGLMIATSFLAACSGEPAVKEPVVTVQVVAVEKTTLHHTVSAEAILFPLAQSAITPKISAPVKEFYVKRGSSVHKGQLLAILENKDLTAAAQDAKGAYDQAQATYEISTGAGLPEEMRKAELDTKAAKQALDAQQKIYDSRKDLYEQGALPRKELDQSAVDLTQARNQYEIAEQHFEALTAIGKQQTLKSASGQLESARGKYLGARAGLDYSQIRSPIDGVVADRPFYPGEMATAGTPLLTVMDVSQVVARAHIPQSDVSLLKVGDDATISVPGEDGFVAGKITVVSPALDPNSTTVEVWIQMKNPEQRLKPGSSVQLSILAKTINDAIIIPASSVLTAQDGATSVMVAGTDGRAHQTAVNVGVRQGDDVQIVNGLQAGDRVVATGAYGLPNGARISIEQAVGKSETGATR
jgi:HlyD family secretion protein